MRLAVEGKHVMRTQAIEGDILTNNHLVDIKVLEDSWLEVVTCGQLHPRLGRSQWRLGRVGRFFDAEQVHDAGKVERKVLLHIHHILLAMGSQMYLCTCKLRYTGRLNS